MAAEPTLVICSSKVRALEQKLHGCTSLAEHLMGFAATDAYLPAATGAEPESCRRCCGALVVDSSDPRV